jgi:hypothetical protein
MKKILFTLATLIMLASCTKENASLVQPAQTPAKQTNFFSQVRRYNDHRTPSVDTVWTLRLESQALVDHYRTMDGYIYETSSTYTKVGVFYSR